MTNFNTQEGFALLRELGALAATPNIHVETVEKANKMITSIVDKVIVPAVQQFTAQSVGLKL